MSILIPFFVGTVRSALFDRPSVASLSVLRVGRGGMTAIDQRDTDRDAEF